MFSSYLRCFCVFGVWAASVTTVSAQENEPSLDLGTIVLRGELQERTLENSPTSAVVVTGEALERKGDQGLYDVIEREPGVSAAFGEKGFSVRGVEQSGVNGGNRALLVTTQVDGVALPNTEATFFGPFSTWDLEQVEILRGPQSTQQGRNALGGAIIVRSKDPSYFPEAKLHFEAGSRDFYRLALMANTPLIEDRLALRFSVEHYQTDGFVTNTTLGLDDFDARDQSTYRAKLRWDPSDTVSVILSYARTSNAGGEDFVVEALNGDRFFPGNRISTADQVGREGADHDNIGLRVNWEINDALRLESETSYYHLNYFRREDADQSPLPFPIFVIDAEAKVFEQEMRLRFDTGSFTGVVGAFFTSIEDTNESSFTGTTRSTTDNFAIFGEVDIAAERLLTGLSFTVGARYDFEKFSFTNISGAMQQNQTTDYDAFLPKLGVTYEFAQNQQLSFTVQRGYRSGTVQVNSFDGGVNNVDPEFTTNYELAYRGAFYDDSLRVSANVFFAQWRDQQVRTLGPSGNIADQDIRNAGSSEYWGGELSLEGQASTRLSLFGAVAYVNSEFKDFQFIQNGMVVNFAGNEFRGAPEWTASFGGTYRWDNGLSLSMDAAFTDASFFDVSNDPGGRNDARWVVNAELVYEHQDSWVAGLYVRNLFDDAYASSRFTQTSLVPAVIPSTVVRSGEPRTFGVFVTKTF